MKDLPALCTRAIVMTPQVDAVGVIFCLLQAPYNAFLR
jgi:hypothetical protein